MGSSGLSAAEVDYIIQWTHEHFDDAGVRLFQRSTRKLTVTEADQQLLASVRTHLRGIQTAVVRNNLV